MWADHPAWTRPPAEPDLWRESQAWNEGIILWAVSPDGRTREPIPYYQSGKGVVDEAGLLARLQEILARHKVGPARDPEVTEAAWRKAEAAGAAALAEIERLAAAAKEPGVDRARLAAGLGRAAATLEECLSLGRKLQEHLRRGLEAAGAGKETPPADRQLARMRPAQRLTVWEAGLARARAEARKLSARN